MIGYTLEGIPEMYILRSEDNFVPRKGVTGFECIGVPYIADYLLNRLYKSDIKTEAGAEMCVLCIQETSSQDRSVGGPTHVASFSSDKSFKEMALPEIEKLKKKAEQFQLSQKNRFYWGRILIKKRRPLQSNVINQVNASPRVMQRNTDLMH